jgi:histidyl-tRNA synthetase
MIERPRGTRDFLPEELSKRRFVEARLRNKAESYGYREIATPAIESLELFIAKSGPGVVKELYDFKDKGGRDICLRPELTLPTMRLFAADLRAWPRPVKVYYYGPVYRYEEPQKGRYREFWQFGVELIGADTPEADAEVIALANEAIESLGLTNLELRVGHIGFVRALVAAAGLEERSRQALFQLLDKKDFAGLEATLDSLRVAAPLKALLLEAGQFKGGHEELARFAGKVMDLPSAHAAVERLLAVLKSLERRGVNAAHVDLSVVRGLDYYTGVVFEFHTDRLGAESQCGGGGAYSLTEIFGLPREGTVGFGLGFDRLVMLVADDAVPSRGGAIDALVVPIGDKEAVLDLAAKAETALRGGGVRVERDLLGRGPSKSLKYADGRGARIAILVGDKEVAETRVTFRDLKSGEQTLMTVDEAVTRAQTILGCA